MADWDLSSIRSGLQDASEQMREGAADGLERVTKEALAMMQAVVPVRSGALRASGRYEVDRENLRSAVGFGSGKTAEYAVVEHESMSNHHPNGQAKFAELPFVSQVVPTAGQKIAAAIKGRLG